MFSKKSAAKSQSGAKPNIYALYAGLGTSFSLEILLFTFFGWWLGGKIDTYLQKKELFSYIGLLLFFVLALIHVVRSVLILQKRLENDENNKEELK
jgi:F0F1-type ATP synthase assembly protein I